MPPARSTPPAFLLNIPIFVFIACYHSALSYDELMARRFFVNFIRHWLQRPCASLTTLIGFVLIVPLCMRVVLGWSNPLGYLSDLGIAGLLIVLLYRRPRWLALPVLLVWSLMTLATAELVSAVGRLPNASDLHYLIDPQFLENSTGGGFAQPWLAATLLFGLAIWLVTKWSGRLIPAALTPTYLDSPLAALVRPLGSTALVPQ